MVADGPRFRSDSPLTDLSSDEELDRTDYGRNASAGAESTSTESSLRIVDDSLLIIRNATISDSPVPDNGVPESADGNAVRSSAPSDVEMHPRPQPQLQDADDDELMGDSTTTSETSPNISGSELPSTDAPDKQPFITTKGWTLEGLIDSGKSFVEVKRISASASPEELAKAITEFEDKGTPLIISGCHELESWPKDGLFSPEWLIEHGPDCE